ncbi:UNVERIFIED_CONTAM: hypothetical protein HHA_454870 [Hammondia hammondi]|eukprot:XP_008888544.1 hypothetical protein HHA_454870 [Hammondia hammondi]
MPSSSQKLMQTHQQQLRQQAASARASRGANGTGSSPSNEVQNEQVSSPHHEASSEYVDPARCTAYSFLQMPSSQCIVVSRNSIKPSSASETALAPHPSQRPPRHLGSKTTVTRAKGFQYCHSTAGTSTELLTNMETMSLPKLGLSLFSKAPEAAATARIRSPTQHPGRFVAEADRVRKRKKAASTKKRTTDEDMDG